VNSHQIVYSGFVSCRMDLLAIGLKGGWVMSLNNSLQLDFGPRHTIRSSTQRVMRLLIQLLFVIYLFSQVSKPEFWAGWLGAWNLETTTQKPPGTRLIEPGPLKNQLPAGMFIAQEKSIDSSNEPPDESFAPMPLIQGQADSDGPIRTPIEDLPFLMESLTDLDRDLPPALYYHFLDKARQVPTEQLLRDGRRDVTFAHLYRDPREDPKQYRGQLLSMSGIVRRAVSFEIPDNAYGLKKRYELWIFTEDSGKYPWVVELTDLPPGFPLGTEIQAKVETAGFFLKLWAYRAQDGFRSAPVLLGNGLQWKRSDQVRERFNNQFGLILGGFLGLFLLIIVIALRKWRLEDLASRKSTGFDQLTDRFAGIPEQLDLNAGVFPEPKFDYIVQETSDTTIGEVGSPTQPLERQSSDSETKTDPEELHL
jgi:hypothetical protein